VPDPVANTTQRAARDGQQPGLRGALLRPGTDPLESVSSGLDPVDGSGQRPPQRLFQIVLGYRRHAVSCSKIDFSAAIARAVWLFTAPLLMPIVAAMSASERSA